MPFRIDTGTLRPAKRTPTGLRADAHITRTGVFKYRNPDGSQRLELRDDPEVHDPDSLASFAGVPVTDDHPAAPLDPSNAAAHARGAVGENVRRDGDRVAASITVYDAALIARMDRGKVEVSCGYSCDLDETPGVHPRYGRYDAVQRNIRGNHVAIVDVGRAGPEVRVRMDGAAIMIDEPAAGARHDEKDTAMEWEKLYNAEKMRADAAEKRASEAETRAETERKRADAAEVAAHDAKKNAEALERQRADAASKFDTAVVERVALVAAAATVLRTDNKPDDVSKLDNRAIKVAMVKRIDGFDIEAGRSDDFVDAMYISASKRADAAAKALGDVNRNANGGGNGGAPREDAEVDPETAAKNKMIADNAAAAKKGA